MKFILTKKDVIAFNQEFEDEIFHNETSLDFALSYARKTENWIKALSFLVRAILIDHVFQEGNKRTTLLLVKSYARYEGHEIYDDKMINSIKNIIVRNITDAVKIEEMLKDAIK